MVSRLKREIKKHVNCSTDLHGLVENKLWLLKLPKQCMLWPKQFLNNLSCPTNVCLPLVNWWFWRVKKTFCARSWALYPKFYCRGDFLFLRVSYILSELTTCRSSWILLCQKYYKEISCRNFSVLRSKIQRNSSLIFLQDRVQVYPTWHCHWPHFMESK